MQVLKVWLSGPGLLLSSAINVQSEFLNVQIFDSKYGNNVDDILHEIDLHDVCDLYKSSLLI
jgi:hypothetical protein